MISKKTVLVLGAGASMDYGFPSGEELLQDIINILKGKFFDEMEAVVKCMIAYIACCFMRNQKIDIEFTDENSYYKLMLEGVDDFKAKLIRSNAASIDDFIDKQGIRLKVIGKILIILAISYYEREDRLSYREEKVKEGHRYYERCSPKIGASCVALTRGWYNHLWAKLYEDDIANDLKKLTIISFNYDRSFEQYLYNGIKSMSSMSEQESKDCLNADLCIHHVYGQLGKLPWQNHGGMAENNYCEIPILKIFAGLIHNTQEALQNLLNFDTIDQWVKDKKDLNVKQLCEIVNTIRTYTEASEKDDHNKIIERLATADSLFFLGFGYHPQNIKWLEGLSLQNNKKIIYSGTTYKKGRELVNQIKTTLARIFSESSTTNSTQRSKPRIGTDFIDLKIKDYLENVVNIE